MKASRALRHLQLLFCASLLLFGAIIAEGQAANLLVNSGFEGNFSVRTGDSPRAVADNWQPWNVPRTASMPSFQNAAPRYLAAATASAQGIMPRIRSGNNAQIYYSFFETHDGGIYQQVSGITPGTELRFSIYAHVWSSTFEDANTSEDPGDVALRVGIDPNGGTNALDSAVVYSTPAVFYDAYRQYSVIATANSSTITVFVRSTVGQPVQNTYVYLDDAVLEVTTSSQPQPSATNTSVPPTNTSVPPTATNTVTSNTAVPATATTVAASATPVATITPLEPTPTRELPVVATATPIGAVSTPVAPQPTAVATSPGAPISDQFPGSLFHTVRAGDTVFGLAQLYGSTIEAIIQANGLDSNGFILRGQVLLIPVRIPNPATETPSPTPLVPVVTVPPTSGGQPPASGNTYVVQPGDTLGGIALRFNTTVATLVQLNSIANPNRIFWGQRLLLPQPPAAPVTPPPPAAPTTYVVQPGDTLFRIAVRFNVSMSALATANNIQNVNRIFWGQTLIIPTQ